MKYEWWNEVVKEDWEVLVLVKNDEAYAVWPYYKRKKMGVNFLANPHFSPYVGPFLTNPKNAKVSKKIAFEHDSYSALIDQLPKAQVMEFNFPLSFNNGLAFNWNGFKTGLKYTYLLNLNLAEDELFASFRENIRRQIKKAEKNFKIIDSSDANLLKEMLNNSFSNSIPLSYFERLVTYVEKNKCGELKVAAFDNSIQASVLTIWDNDSAYYLIGGKEIGATNYGAMSLLLWNSIKNSKQRGLKLFNFEGSSIKNVEHYLRGFGGELVSSHRYEKNSSKLLEMVR